MSLVMVTATIDNPGSIISKPEQLRQNPVPKQVEALFQTSLMHHSQSSAEAVRRLREELLLKIRVRQKVIQVTVLALVSESPIQAKLVRCFHDIYVNDNTYNHSQSWGHSISD